MTELAKMELPNFISTYALVWYTKNPEPTRVKCRINPFHVSSYCEAIMSNGTKEVPCTIMYCGATSYNLEMTVDEIDKMMENIDRGVSIRE